LYEPRKDQTELKPLTHHLPSRCSCPAANANKEPSVENRTSLINPGTS
uniref:Uncharacterized protein n=1 Tax=Haemonchus placei TaxID=6290 RepID=A0A0N4WT24_HAEPC